MLNRKVVAVLAAGAFLGVWGLTAYEAVSMVGKPFNGFFVESRANVAGFQAPSWKISELGLSDSDQIQAVDEKPFMRSREIYRATLAHPVGTALQYDLIRDGHPRRATVRTRTFTWADFHETHSLLLIQGLMPVIIGLLVFLFGTDRIVANTMFAWSFLTGLGGVLLFDFSSLGLASRWLYALSIAGGAAELGFAVSLLHRFIGKRWLKILLWAIALPAGAYIGLHQLVFADANLTHRALFPFYDLNVALSRNSVWWFLVGESSVFVSVLWLLARSKRGTQDREDALLLLVASVFVQLSFVLYAIYLVAHVSFSLPYSVTMFLGLVGQGIYAYAMLRRKLFGLHIRDLLDQNARLELKVQERTRELEQVLRDLKETQAQLVHSERLRAMGVLVANTAHHLKNPASFIATSVELLEEYLQGIQGLAENRELPPTVREGLRVEDLSMMVDVIRTGSDRILELTLNLGVFSRRETQELRRLVDLKACLESVLSLAIPPKGVQVHADLQAVPHVYGVESELALVVTNLLVNAYQALKGRGAVWISLFQDDGSVRVEVSDDGPGIPTKIQGRIFDPFFTTKPAGEGTGLGLAIAERIVHSHGGTIEVMSEPGNGARFAVRLPAHEPARLGSPLPVAFWTDND